MEEDLWEWECPAWQQAGLDNAGQENRPTFAGSQDKRKASCVSRCLDFSLTRSQDSLLLFPSCTRHRRWQLLRLGIPLSTWSGQLMTKVFRLPYRIPLEQLRESRRLREWGIGPAANIDIHLLFSDLSKYSVPQQLAVFLRKWGVWVASWSNRVLLNETLWTYALPSP